MSQLPGNYDLSGAPLPSVEVKPVETQAYAPEEKQKGWFGSLFTNFGSDFAATARNNSTTGEGGGNPRGSGFDFSRLIAKGENGDKTNALLLQLFVFVGLMVIVLFAFKFFKK